MEIKMTGKQPEAVTQFCKVNRE